MASKSTVAYSQPTIWKLLVQCSFIQTTEWEKGYHCSIDDYTPGVGHRRQKVAARLKVSEVEETSTGGCVMEEQQFHCCLMACSAQTSSIVPHECEVYLLIRIYEVLE